jgi:hypothetical protein
MKDGPQNLVQGERHPHLERGSCEIVIQDQAGLDLTQNNRWIVRVR